MKERGILFSAPMVRALLAGTKTQTRRAVKPQPHHVDGGVPFGDPPAWAMRDGAMAGSAVMRSRYGTRVDRLWVRETMRRGPAGIWQYAADGADVKLPAADERVPLMVAWAHHKEGDTCVSIHMPRWASRITLEVVAVGVERLQAISEADAKAEGAEPLSLPRVSTAELALLDWPLQETDNPHRNGYAMLWQQINGAGSWDANPFVWVLTFRRV